MTALDKLNDCKYLVVDNLLEPSQNTLLLQVITGTVSEHAEMVPVAGTEIGPYRRVNFDNGETYDILFDTYISYLVVNETFHCGMSGEYVGIRIRRYLNSQFIEFCKEQNMYIQLWDDREIVHYCIVTDHHIVHVLTVDEPTITKTE